MEKYRQNLQQEFPIELFVNEMEQFKFYLERDWSVDPNSPAVQRIADQQKMIRHLYKFVVDILKNKL